MQPAYIVTGTVTDAQTLKLDEALPVQEGRVRLVVELLPGETKPGLREILAGIHQGQQGRGYVPPSRAEVDAYLKAERDSWDEG